MTQRVAILKEVEELPDALLGDVLLYLRSLKMKVAGQGAPGVETALLSESSLAKDWNRPEEDEAWSDL